MRCNAICQLLTPNSALPSVFNPYRSYSLPSLLSLFIFNLLIPATTTLFSFELIKTKADNQNFALKTGYHSKLLTVPIYDVKLNTIKRILF
jgi:hypothetical protein